MFGGPSNRMYRKPIARLPDRRSARCLAANYLRQKAALSEPKSIRRRHVDVAPRPHRCLDGRLRKRPQNLDWVYTPVPKIPRSPRSLSYRYAPYASGRLPTLAATPKKLARPTTTREAASFAATRFATHTSNGTCSLASATLACKRS